ncbi:MAG: type III pantothenate kinase [Moraxella sp.]|nr:type III pantothenate kinase [Moraxella sp.]
MTTLMLDLGNTRLKYWLLDDNHTIVSHDAHLHLKAPNELLLGLSDTFARFAPRFIGISSVLGMVINQAVSQSLDTLCIPYEFAKVSATHPQLITHDHPEQLGVDRWLQMLGAVDDAQKQCIVGCGTALTIDLLDKGVHLGGYIFPNVHLQRQALYAGTQQIAATTKAVPLDVFNSLAPAQNTQEAVNHGILLSVVGAINTITHAHPDHTLILTGGDAPSLAPHLNPAQHPIAIEDNLLLKGLVRYFVDK